MMLDFQNLRKHFIGFIEAITEHIHASFRIALQLTDSKVTGYITVLLLQNSHHQKKFKVKRKPNVELPSQL